MKPPVISQRQTGTVLIAGLIILLLLTILGLASMQNTALQERMAGSFDQRNDAFQYAELALRAAELEHAESVPSGQMGLEPPDTLPKDCPDIDQLGCGGSNITASSACLAALNWQSVALGGGVDAEASFSVLPVENRTCGVAASEGETIDTNSPYGTVGVSGISADNRMILARGKSGDGASVVLIKGLYRPPLLDPVRSDDAT